MLASRELYSSLLRYLQAAGLASSGPTIYTSNTTHRELYSSLLRFLQAAGLAPSGPELLMVVPSPFFLT